MQFSFFLFSFFGWEHAIFKHAITSETNPILPVRPTTHNPYTHEEGKKDFNKLKVPPGYF